MQVQGRQKMPLGNLLRAIDACRSVNELFALVRREGIEIRMRSQSAASNIDYKPLEKNPAILPLDTLKEQVREAAIEAHRQSTERLVRAVETCPTIDKLFELVKNEHINIRMDSFSSASNLPQIKPLDIQPKQETPRDDRKEQLIRAVEATPSIDKLFELVKNEHIEIRMKSFSSASNLPQIKPTEIQPKPETSPLDRLKEQVVQAVTEMPRENPNERLIRAVEATPSIDKLFELVKNEHIDIRMDSFSSASNLPHLKPSGILSTQDQSPLDRLKQQVLKAVTSQPVKHTDEQILRAVEACPTVDKLVALVKNEQIKIPMTDSVSVPEQSQTEQPEILPEQIQVPLEELREQLLKAVTGPSDKHTKEQILRAVETCPTVDKLLTLAKNEHIQIPADVFSSVSEQPQTELPEILPEQIQVPLEELREQLLKAVTGPSDKHTKEQILRAVETCPTVKKLLTLAKNEKIKIPKTVFDSASEQPQPKPSELQFVPEKSPLDRLKEKVIEAIKYAN